MVKSPLDGRKSNFSGGTNGLPGEDGVTTRNLNPGAQDVKYGVPRLVTN